MKPKNAAPPGDRVFRSRRWEGTCIAGEILV